MAARNAHEDATAVVKAKAVQAGLPRAPVDPHPLPPFDAWSCAETWAAGLDPAGVGRPLRERRLAGLISVCLRDSLLYRRRSPHARCLNDFEPVTKTELMGAFDSWAVDRRITRLGVDAFIADPARIADAWLGSCLVWT